MQLHDLHKEHGATLAGDDIPLHYGDLKQEYDAALHHAILLDRSHEGRIRLAGSDRHELLNRMSTNKMVGMATGEGRATIFTNANARIIDRIMAYERDDHLLLITEPGRGAAITDFLQRNIFFNDDVQVQNITDDTVQFAIHGTEADAIVQSLNPDVFNLAPLSGISFQLKDANIFAAKRKPIIEQHWIIITDREQAVTTYSALLETGKAYSLTPAGSLTYNTLRIRAGRPAGRELSSDYLPLEVGLWDEVHFDKGCYTGQEIIARMESRARLAKTIVALYLGDFVEAPADIKHNGTSIGTLTSSVEAPTGERFAIGIIKTAHIHAGTAVTVGSEDVTGTVVRLLGEQPEFLTQS